MINPLDLVGTTKTRVFCGDNDELTSISQYVIVYQGISEYEGDFFHAYELTITHIGCRAAKHGLNRSSSLRLSPPFATQQRFRSGDGNVGWVHLGFRKSVMFGNARILKWSYCTR